MMVQSPDKTKSQLENEGRMKEKGEGLWICASNNTYSVVTYSQLRLPREPTENLFFQPWSMDWGVSYRIFLLYDCLQMDSWGGVVIIFTY